MNSKKKFDKEPDDIGSHQDAILQDESESLVSSSEEDLYKILANNFQVSVYIMQDNRFTFINPRIMDYTGYSKQEMMTIDPISIIHPLDRRMTKKQAV